VRLSIFVHHFSYFIVSADVWTPCGTSPNSYGSWKSQSSHGRKSFIMPTMKLWFLGDVLLVFLQCVPHRHALFNATEHVNWRQKIQCKMQQNMSIKDRKFNAKCNRTCQSKTENSMQNATEHVNQRQKIQCEVSHGYHQNCNTYNWWGIYSCDRTKEQLYHFFIIDKAKDLDEQSPVF